MNFGHLHGRFRKSGLSTLISKFIPLSNPHIKSARPTPLHHYLETHPLGRPTTTLIFCPSASWSIICKLVVFCRMLFLRFGQAHIYEEAWTLGARASSELKKTKSFPFSHRSEKFSLYKASSASTRPTSAQGVRRQATRGPAGAESSTGMYNLFCPSCLVISQFALGGGFTAPTELA